MHVRAPSALRAPTPLNLRRRAWLFDLDGTLVDTSPLHERAFRAALARRHSGLLPGFDYGRIAGLTTSDVFRTLVPEEEIAELVQRKRSAFREELAVTSGLAFPGAARLLDRLRGAGIRVVVVTGSTRAGASATLAAAGLDRRVDGLVSAEDAPRGKPHPEPFLRALALVKLAPADALAIEDAHAGVASARAAGLDVVVVHRVDPSCPSFLELDSLYDAAALG